MTPRGGVMEQEAAWWQKCLLPGKAPTAGAMGPGSRLGRDPDAAIWAIFSHSLGLSFHFQLG